MKTLNLKIVSLAMLLLAGTAGFSQIKKNSLKLPELDGYQLLKCDFHMHTVFSDGMVWPTTRVNEAFQEGLDAIAITDHIEYRPKLAEFTSKDHLHSYEIAKKTADELNVLLIKGTEVTRKMPPGHFNAVFIKDANVFETFVNPKDSRDGTNIAETLAEGKKQEAFVFWNHPWFQHPQNISEWQKVHEELYQKGLISGIEVVNGDRFDPLVLQWCLDKNLTVLANSDIHTPMVLAPGKYRTMTLVFAKERSEAAIKDALVNRLTVAYFNDHLYGKAELVKQIVAKSLICSARLTGAKSGMLNLVNISGIPYELEITDDSEISTKLRSSLGTVRIDALSEYVLPINATALQPGNTYKMHVKVLNTQVGNNQPLELDLSFKL